MKTYTHILAVASACFAISVPAVLAAPLADAKTSHNVTAVEERGSTGIAGGIVGWVAPALQEAMFGKSIQCCQDYPGGNCWAAEDMSPDGALKYDVCYTPGDQIFSQADADVAKCLTDLHYRQPDQCISVAGSSCDNGYIAAGGRIQNAWVSRFYPSTIDSEESWAIQAGIDRLVGQGIYTFKDDLGDRQPIFSAVSAFNDLTAVELYLRYIGQNEC